MKHASGERREKFSVFIQGYYGFQKGGYAAILPAVFARLLRRGWMETTSLFAMRAMMQGNRQERAWLRQERRQ